MRNGVACPPLSWHLWVPRWLVAAAALGAMSAAWPVPPPTVRPDVAVELTPNGPEHVLVLQLDTPSGLPWISGVVPGPDGIDLRLAATAVVRLHVLMSADAARTGLAASFELGLRLRR